MSCYSQVLEAVFHLSKKGGMNRSLSNIKRLCEIYNHPEKAYPTIHVAGTNGKGSVCTKIAACLQEQGYRVGLYTSPHIASFRERIRIDMEMIAEEEIAPLFEEISSTLNQARIEATLFEVATLLAFLYFQKKQVEIAVIETGLGGLWDATNVIEPLVSVITSIGYDHMDVLGPTLEDIGRAKAGIIKRGAPTVIGPDVSYSFMEKFAKESPLIQSAFQDQDFDRENQETARLALSMIRDSFPMSESCLAKGLLAKPSCRFESHIREKEIILDVAHNGHGFARLLINLPHRYPSHNYRFIVGFSKGKNIEECAHLIEEKAFAVHLVGGEHPRLATVDEIAPAFKKKENLFREVSLGEAVRRALGIATEKPEILVIAGSFFIMRDARKALGIEDPEDPCLWYDPCKIAPISYGAALL